MARDFSREFYHTQEWKQCREQYIKHMPRDRRGLCEICYAKGKHVLGEELHHKIHLTPENIHDRSITLNPDNLIFLCRECHKAQHELQYKSAKRYYYDKEGNLIQNPRFKEQTR